MGDEISRFTIDELFKQETRYLILGNFGTAEREGNISWNSSNGLNSNSSWLCLEDILNLSTHSEQNIRSKI